MLNNYHKQQLVSEGEYWKCYKAIKDNKAYFMKEYEVFNLSDQNFIKNRMKMAKSEHLLPVIEQFQAKDKQYVISEWIEESLLTYLAKKEKKILLLSEALQFYAQIVQFIISCHDQSFLIREVDPKKIRVKKDKIFFYDLSRAVLMKRKRKHFDNLNSQFMAPQYNSEDGYSTEADVWASGVILFFMLTGHYPFDLKGKSIEEVKQELQQKTIKGFKLSQNIEKYGDKLESLKNNFYLNDLFTRLFCYDEHERIELERISEHPILKIYFNKPGGITGITSILQSFHQQSIFYSKVNVKSKWVNFLHKQQVILDFIQKSSENLSLECANIFDEEMRFKVHCAVIKMALIKCHNLIDVLYGKIKPFFEVDINEWEIFRKSSAAEEVKKKMERKQKILFTAFRGAKVQFKTNNILFDDNIPKSFNQIKNLYRAQLSIMYRIGRNELKKLMGKQHREQRRRLVESLVRIVIFYLVNRLFCTEQQIQVDFQAYYKWSKFKDFEDLDEWILNEQSKTLDTFIIKMVNKYLISNNNQ